MTTAGTFYPHPRLTECLAAALKDAHPFRVSVVRWGLAVVVRVGGEIDANNVANWECLLQEAASAAAPGLLVIDVDQLDFMGSCGFAALVELSTQCRTRDVTVCLVSNQSITERFIAACGWREALPLYRDVDAALNAYDGRQAAGLTALPSPHPMPPTTCLPPPANGNSVAFPISAGVHEQGR